MSEINEILLSLMTEVDLGFIEVPTIILISFTFILFGLGFRKSLISYMGISVIFGHYILRQFANFF